MLEKFSDSESKIPVDGLDEETDVEVIEINGSKNRIIYGIYHRMRSLVFYNNAEKEKAKRKADRWAIIGVIVFGYLVFVGEPELPIDKWLTILILEMSSATCIIALWFKECFILHGNIRVQYDISIQLEDKFDFLGKPFKYMGYILHSKIKDPNLLNGLYYVALVSITLTLALVGLYNELDLKVHDPILIIGLILITGIDVLMLVLSKISGNSEYKREKLFQRGEIIKNLDD